MVCKRVYLRRKLDSDTLERALTKSAEDVGLKIKIKEDFNKNYELNPVEEIKKYNGTDIKLKRGLIPMMNIFFDRGVIIYNHYFLVKTGFYDGFARKKTVKKYLQALSENLDALTTNKRPEIQGPRRNFL